MEGLGIISQPSRMLDCGNGESYELRPLNLRDWATLEEEALSQYKRSRIKTWTENADLLPASMRESALMDAFNRAEKITASDIPEVAGKVPLIDAEGVPEIDPNGRVVMVDGTIPFAQAWMNSFAGKLHSCWLSIRKAKAGMTLEDAAEIFRRSGTHKLAEAANAVFELSRSKLKNESAPALEAKTENQEAGAA